MNLEILKQRAKAFDYLFDAVVVTDLQGIIVDWNKGSEELYGYSKEEALGQPVNILHVPMDVEHVTAEVIATVASHGKWSGEVRSVHKNGKIGWIESMCVPIFDDNGKVTGALGINRDISERKKETERLEYLAHYDTLTKIPNRCLLLDRVKHLISQSKREKRAFALLFIDLNKFKMINDTKGHVFGDQVLIEFALRLQSSIRDSDTVARFGGDEFVILLENINSKNAALKMIKTIARTLNADCIINNEITKINCSIGIAIYPDDGLTTDKLLSKADKAMYKAKLNHVQ
jgi:diguanylate cyclase (GGDEF)-like protein/PAS domain S-box-containing protein